MEGKYLYRIGEEKKRDPSEVGGHVERRGDSGEAGRERGGGEG